MIALICACIGIILMIVGTFIFVVSGAKSPPKEKVGIFAFVIGAVFLSAGLLLMFLHV